MFRVLKLKARYRRESDASNYSSDDSRDRYQEAKPVSQDVAIGPLAL